MMPRDPSTLDGWFGPRNDDKTYTNDDKTYTNWPDAPERLRPLLDTWQEVTGLRFKRDRKFQIKCAHDWYEEFGGDPDLVRRAYSDFKKIGYNYKSLGSIHSTARRLKGKSIDPDSEEETEKYLKWIED